MGRAGRVKAHLRRRRDERGAALIEAVIVIPLLLLLTFGAVEFGIGYSQKAGLETLARAGARKTATLQGANASATDIGDQTTTAVNAAIAQTSVPTLKFLYVYRIAYVSPGVWDTTAAPSSFGGPCGSGSGGDCIKYPFDTATKLFDLPGTGSWPGTAGHRNACTAGTEDRVGVQVQGEFAFLSGLVGSGTVRLTATSVLQLEPTAC